MKKLLFLSIFYAFSCVAADQPNKIDRSSAWNWSPTINIRFYNELFIKGDGDSPVTRKHDDVVAVKVLPNMTCTTIRNEIRKKKNTDGRLYYTVGRLLPNNSTVPRIGTFDYLVKDISELTNPLPLLNSDPNMRHKIVADVFFVAEPSKTTLSKPKL
jgi:hypothetical protein